MSGVQQSVVTNPEQCFWTKKTEDIDLEDLQKVSTFATGGYSHVSLVQLRDHPTSAFALKAIPKTKIADPDERMNLLREKTILNKVRSDFIVRLYRTFKTKTHLYLLTEYLPGGDLSSCDKLPENDARFYVGCMVEALDCLRNHNVVHNDLRTANLVLDAAGYLKLIDFGFAVKLPPGEKLRGFDFGTVQYIPPEFDLSRDKAGDLWALGVILYELLTGVTPFVTGDIICAGDYRQTLRNISKGIDAVSFPRTDFSEAAEDLVRKLCAHDAESRLGYESIEEIRNHRWFADLDWQKLRCRQLTPPAVPKLDSVLDTTNFSQEVSDSDIDVEEDESNWDEDF